MGVFLFKDFKILSFLISYLIFNTNMNEIKIFSGR